jgi:hypothetical protein
MEMDLNQSSAQNLVRPGLPNNVSDGFLMNYRGDGLAGSHLRRHRNFITSWKVP